MKIKTVCELTGLSDRTIRYYIEEKLISPSHTENYLGRKKYSFSEHDIDALKDIAVLRKYDITVEEIRKIINDPKASRVVIDNAKIRAQDTVNAGQSKLYTLSNIDTNRLYTVSELANKLSEFSYDLEFRNKTIPQHKSKYFLSCLKNISILLIAHLPIILSLIILMIDINYYRYPNFSYNVIGLTFLSLLPSLLLLVLPKAKLKWKLCSRRILIILCIISIPISSIFSLGIVQGSETYDIRHYLDFDADCTIGRGSLFRELFPTWPHYSGSTYLYRNLPAVDYTYDVYAEWSLSNEEYAAETKRASDIMRDEAIKNTGYLNYSKIEKGDFMCLILYDGNEPFTEATANYYYLIFAYNDKTNTVRYICCDSLENGVDQPYYLNLKW